MTDYLDSDTVSLVLTVSGIEERQRYDTGTARVTFTPSGVEQRISTDAATVSIVFTPSANERFGPLLLAFTSVSQSKWDSELPTTKWTMAEETLKKWSVTYAGKVSDVPTG